MELAVACIPESFAAWRDFVTRVGSVSETLHLDVCDGKFVGSRSWPITGDGGEWRRFVSQEEGLPGWDDHDFEVDLMVADPGARFREFVEAGFVRVVVHWETLGPDYAENIEPITADGRADIWLAASPETDPSAYLPALGSFAGFQCMGITKVGFQGQPFEERALGVVRTVRAANPSLPIAVDGGVSLATAGAIAAAGATKLVVGSAILKAENLIAMAGEILAATE